MENDSTSNAGRRVRSLDEHPVSSWPTAVAHPAGTGGSGGRRPSLPPVPASRSSADACMTPEIMEHLKELVVERHPPWPSLLGAGMAPLKGVRGRSQSFTSIRKLLPPGEEDREGT